MRRPPLYHPTERIFRGGYEIRPLHPSDLPQVIDLEARSFAHPWSPELVAREMEQEQSLILVVLAEGKVVGFAIVWVILDEIHVLNVAVEPGLRRRGIGGLLLRELMERGRQGGMEVVHLEVRAGNEAAIALYRSLGFEEAGMRKGYYADGEDALVMQRSLRAAGA